MQSVPGGIEIVIKLHHCRPAILEIRPIGSFQRDGLQVEIVIMRGFHQQQTRNKSGHVVVKKIFCEHISSSTPNRVSSLRGEKVKKSNKAGNENRKLTQMLPVSIIFVIALDITCLTNQCKKMEFGICCSIKQVSEAITSGK
jgi:hypothetical protein